MKELSQSHNKPRYDHQFDRPDRPIKKAELPPLIEAREEMKVYQGVKPDVYGDRVEMEAGPDARRIFEKTLDICRVIKEKGGTALFVGGVVRDEVRGALSRDFDIEVYGLTAEEIEEIVKPFGMVSEVGKAFEILKMTDPSGYDIDISLPRKNSKVGEGHKGFHNMSVKEAARRRDFTFNTLAKDPLTGEIFDAFGGIEDLQTRTLRITDEELFKDDPLRVMRGAQFVARLGLRIDPETMQIMRGMLDELETLPKERMAKEWDKLLLKPDRPSMGLQALFDIGVIHKLYPELAILRETDQEFDWHPEGDVWVHTLMVVDAARTILQHYGIEGETAKTVMYAALCHDIGKPATTEIIDGRITSRGHEPAGEKPTKIFLEKLGIKKAIEKKVAVLVRNHLIPGTFFGLLQKGEEVSPGAIRRLADRLGKEGATIEELTYVAEADNLGRGPYIDPQAAEQFQLPIVSEAYGQFRAGYWLREKAKNLGVLQEVPKEIFFGRDLIALGFKPGIIFGKIIQLSKRGRDEKNWTREDVLRIVSEHSESPEACIEGLEQALEK